MQAQLAVSMSKQRELRDIMRTILLKGRAAAWSVVLYDQRSPR